jgi:hypothetical protein
MYDQEIAAWQEILTLNDKRDHAAALERAYKLGGITRAWRWDIEQAKKARADRFEFAPIWLARLYAFGTFELVDNPRALKEGEELKKVQKIIIDNPGISKNQLRGERHGPVTAFSSIERIYRRFMASPAIRTKTMLLPLFFWYPKLSTQYQYRR